MHWGLHDEDGANGDGGNGLDVGTNGLKLLEGLCGFVRRIRRRGMGMRMRGRGTGKRGGEVGRTSASIVRMTCVLLESLTAG